MSRQTKIYEHYDFTSTPLTTPDVEQCSDGCKKRPCSVLTKTSPEKKTRKSLENSAQGLIALTNIKKFAMETSLFNLLDEISQDFLKKCVLLKHPALIIICRLYWRQHNWHKIKTLLQIWNKENADTPTLQLILHSLVERSILVSSSSKGANCLSYEDLKTILTSDEIQKVCDDLKIVKSRKGQVQKTLKESLDSFCKKKPIDSYFKAKYESNDEIVNNRMRAKAGTCYKLSDSANKALKKIYLLMYIDIPYKVVKKQKPELTYVYDIIFQEPFLNDKSIILDSIHFAFNSPQEFDRFERAHSVYESFVAEKQASKRCEIIKSVYNLYQSINEIDMKRYMAYPEWLYNPLHMYMKVLKDGVRDLKRQKNDTSYLLSVEILTTLIKQNKIDPHSIGDCYANKALILFTNFHEHEKAAELLIEGFKSEASDEVKEIMQRRAAKRIFKKSHISEELRAQLETYVNKYNKLDSNLPSNIIKMQTKDNGNKDHKGIKYIVQIGDKEEYMKVEELCIYHYKTTEGFTHAEHWEGNIVRSIFYLLFWDIIYIKPNDVSGIFLTCYQRYPLDMFCESFYKNRKAVIDDKLFKIASWTEDQLLDEMRNTWSKTVNYELPDIDRKINWESISMVTSCLGPEKTAVICKRLVTNYGYTINGFPDVTAWDINTKKVKFIEAKSHSDKPFIKQLQWMHYLRSNGIDTEFFKVKKENSSLPSSQSASQTVRTSQPLSHSTPSNLQMNSILQLQSYIDNNDDSDGEENIDDGNDDEDNDSDNENDNEAIDNEDVDDDYKGDIDDNKGFDDIDLCRVG